MNAFSPTEKHLETVQRLWGLQETPQLHRRVENFVYRTSTAEGSKILRLTDPGRRTRAQIESELDWQNAMSAKGAPCARPRPSQFGRLVEEITDASGESWWACLFDKASGAPLGKEEDYTPDRLRAWGRTLAEFHRLTRDYAPSTNIAPRLPWDEDFRRAIWGRVSDSPDSLISKRVEESFAWLRSLPQTPATYGLVHTDLHDGNFFMEGSRLTVFDFDDACYHWFAYDLAVPLYYLRLRSLRWKNVDVPAMERELIAGYRTASDLDAIWYDRLEAFVHFRGLIMYRWSQAQLQNPQLDAGLLDWCRDNITDWNPRLEKPYPFV